MKIYGDFFALEQRPGISNLYKIYVTDNALCGAVIAGKYVSEKTAKTMQVVKPVLSRAFYESIQAREEACKYYDGLELGGPLFLNANKANFSIGQALIQGAKLTPLHWFPKMMTNGTERFGNFYLYTTDGRKRHFALFGTQTLNEVATAVRHLIPNVEM